MAARGKEAMDAAFMAAAQNSGGIQPLLQNFFRFLHEKTDFYVVDPRPKRPMGFDSGVAEQLVLNAFRAWPMKDPDGRVASEQPPSHRVANPQPQVQATEGNKSPPSPATHATAAENLLESVDSPPPSAAAQGGGSSRPLSSVTAAAHKADKPPTIQYTESGSQIPIGNGGVGPDGAYVWTQTLQDCTVLIPVPPSCTGKKVQGVFKPTSVELIVRDVPAASLVGELGGDVVPDECLFTLDRDSTSCTLTVTFEKRTETWWRSVVKGHPEIDASMVDSTRHVSEYDDETQATIRKLVAEQYSKRSG